MDNQSAVDRSILIPVGVGAMSIIGIIVILLVGRSLNAPAQIAVTESATPFQFVYLGTEPAIVTPLFEGSVIPVTEEPEPDDEEPIEPPPVLVTPTRPAASTPIQLTLAGTASTPTSSVLRTNTPVQLVTSTLSSPVSANTIDDTHSRHSYAGGWLPQTGVSGAYQGTLHISTAAGNSVSFTFTGSQIRLFYQASPSFGTITITIDGVGEPPLSQSQSETEIVEWSSDLLTQETHTVVIEHESGGSVNIDSFVLPASTPTPTRTPTSTPTQ